VDIGVWESYDGLGKGFAPRLARAVVATVFTLYLVMNIINLLWHDHKNVVGTVLAAVCMSLVLVGNLLHISRFAPKLRRSKLGYSLLAVQALLTYAPLALGDISFISVPGFFAGSALLILPTIPGIICLGAVTFGAFLVMSRLLPDSPLDMAYYTIFVLAMSRVV
jgi:two-component system sensor histidine kinase DesK